MHSRVWLAYAVISRIALSAALPQPSRARDVLTTAPLKMIIPRNVSAATANASYLSEVPKIDPLSLDHASPHPSNYSDSASLYDLFFGYDLPAVISAVPQCDGTALGTYLNKHSCFDAWRNMGWISHRVSWGPRGLGHNFQYRLPYRWSSDDGQCVIDVVPQHDRSSDFASLLEIRYAAEQVMKKCIDPVSSPAEGGFVANIGKDGRLVVIIRKYTPDVACGQEFDAPFYPPLCRDTLSALPASMYPVGFGRQGSPGVQWPVPWNYHASGSRCAATVRIKGTALRETIRWFDIWAGAVAVDAICIKRNKVGVSRNLGDHKYGSITLQNSDQLPAPVPLAVAGE